MSTLLCLFIAAAAPYIRVADKTVAPAIDNRLVWVFFTDKGVFNDADCAIAARVAARTMSPEVLSRRERSRAGGIDFDDLPVRQSYLQAIEATGARLRTVSNWLNAASFEMPPDLARRTYELPFVYDVKPVGSRTATADDFPLGLADRVHTRSVDTATSHRFYGPSWDQAQMMGVPELFFRGFFGSNVKLAIFDTGLKLTNRGIARARVYKQHDFLSGDNLQSATSAGGWNPATVDGVRFQGLVRDPAATVVQSQSGSNDTMLLAFVADSFAYGFNSPRRALFGSYSTDGGSSWSSPAPLVLSRAYDHTYENLVLSAHGPVTYVVCNDLAVGSVHQPASASVFIGFFAGTTWTGPLSLVGAGRYPATAIIGDTLYLGFVTSDSSVTVVKYLVAQAEPIQLSTTYIHPGRRLSAPQITAAVSGTVDVVVTTADSGQVLQYRSIDGGATFDQSGVLVASGAARTRIARRGGDLMVVYEDGLSSPFSRLAVLRSTDSGATWQQGADVVDSAFAIGGFSAAADDQAVVLAYESGGMAYRTSTTDLGGSWAAPQALDTTGFNLAPVLASTDGNTVALWFKRGDDQAVWESSDTIKFSREQPQHGTRMASIIAGYQQGGVIGIAPGVDLLVAKTELHKTRSGRFYEYNMEEDTYIEALEWADRMGADIVSTSLGYRAWYGDDQFDGKTAPISIAASLAARRGLIVVTAMGNRDSSYYPWPQSYIVAPGDADGVITAGGVEKNLTPWRGTGTGPTSDGRTKPDLVALSDTVAVVSPDSLDYLDGSVGTSCATALIAGACALVKEAHPTWSADSIIAVMFATASRSTKSCTFGFGVPRVDSIYKLYPPDTGIEDVAGDEIGLIFPNPYRPAEHDKVYFQINITRPAFEARISIFTPSGTLIDTVTLDATVMSRPGRYGDNGDVATIERVGAVWDGRNQSGKPVAAGLYVAVLQTTFGRGAAKFALVR